MIAGVSIAAFRARGVSPAMAAAVLAPVTTKIVTTKTGTTTTA